MGGPSGLSAQFSIQSERPRSELGDCLSTGVGDVDGDGYGDVVRIQRERSTATYFGGPLGMPVRPFSFSSPAISNVVDLTTVSPADFDGDGTSEVLVGFTRTIMAINRGSLVTTQSSSPDIDLTQPGAVLQRFLRSRVARPGDVNGDGWPDVLETRFCAITAPAPNCARDEVSLFLSRGASPSFGQATVFPFDITSDPRGLTELASGVPGDLDGDGLDDAVVVRGQDVMVLSGVPGSMRLSMRATTSTIFEREVSSPIL